MKKLVLFAAAAVAISFASCNKGAEATEASAEAPVEEVVAPEAVEVVEGDSAAVEVVEIVDEAAPAN